MNAPEPKLPLQPAQTQALRRLRRAHLGRADHARADRLHRDPGEEPDVRCRMAAPRPHRACGARRGKLGREPTGAGSEARGGAHRRPHAGHLLRGAGHEGGQHRHDLPVRPPRQAARVRRLAQRPRAMDAEVRQRQAVRTRQCRRWLCGVCVARLPSWRSTSTRSRARVASASSKAARKAARPTCLRTSTC